MGARSGADHRAYQRYFNKFSQAVNQRVFGELSSRFFSELLFDNYTLDFDSTVMVREGNQEGAVKGYNPKRPGRPPHHPLLAFVSDIRMIANYWLRPGNTVSSSNYLSFLEDTLSRLRNKTVGLIRMDSGFFTKEILVHLENKHLSETTYKADSWDKPRRIAIAKIVYDSYRGRADSENRIKELNPNRSLDHLAVCLTVFLRLSKPFRLAVGILSAALSRRSPLRLRQRRQPICTAAKRNRFGL